MANMITVQVNMTWYMITVQVNMAWYMIDMHMVLLV